MGKVLSDGLEKAAYNKIRQMILSKKLTPGQKIVQEQLAETLGISRTPLRSALQKLEAEHLVESIPRRGVTVKKFTDQEIAEIYDCRVALETTAVRLFTQQRDATTIKNLRNLFSPFIDTSQPVNAQEYLTADKKFHDTIIRHCGNSFLYKLFQQGNLLLYIDWIGLVRPPEETISEHLAIVEAMAAHDADRAELLMKEHLIHSQRIVVEQS